MSSFTFSRNPSLLRLTPKPCQTGTLPQCITRFGWLILLLGLGSPSMTQAQFTQQLSSILSQGQAVSQGDAALADFDGNGKLDLIVTGRRQGGTPATRVYINNGLLLNSILSGITDLYNSRLDVGDFNNDGTVDIVICGDDGANAFTKVYSNSGTPNFTDQSAINVNLPQVTNGDVAWADYDNDGDLDLIVVGFQTSTGTKVAQIIENRVPQGGGFLLDVDASAALTGVDHASVAWADYDKDGRLDLVISGLNSSGQSITYLYRNLGNSQFVFIPAASFQGVSHGTVAWGDENNDGYPDLLLCGENGLGGRFTQIYRNQSNMNPTQPFAAPVSLTGVTNGKALWADYNNDGWVDILVAGQNGPTDASRLTQLYENNQNGSFSPVTTTLVHVNASPAIAIGDYLDPVDGKVDIFLTGISTSPITTNFYMYRNVGTNANTVPAPPSGLTYTTVGNSIEFSWNSPAGYPAALRDGLSYEVYIGTSPTIGNIDPSHAAIPGGKRYVQRFGEIRDTSWQISGLPANPNYFVAVQAIDAALEGSGFSSVINFPVVNVTPALSEFDDSTNYAFGTTQTGTTEGYVSWCDCNNDGELDFLYGGNTSTSPLTNTTRLYTNDGDGTFTFRPLQSAAIARIYRGAAAWADINNDGLPDLAVCGLNDSGSFGTAITNIYLNTGNNCQMGTPISLEGVSRGSLDWGDVDGDGDMDLLVTGKGTFGNITRIYLNSYAQTGVVSFTNSTNTFSGVEYGEAKFGDFDNDGDLDFAICGSSTVTPSGTMTKVYVNDGNGNFSDPGYAVFSGVRQGSLAWADIDNDGQLELIVAGNLSASGFQPSVRVYKYFSSLNLFLSLTVPGLSDGTVKIADGSIDLGDFDDDGLIDILITGRTGDNFSSAPITTVLRNLGNSQFTPDILSSSNLTNVFGDSEAKWGDYNGDKKLDVALIGTLANSNRVMQLYKNVGTSPNVTPNPPSNLQATLSNFEVELSWSAPIPPSNNPGRVNGYSYDLYIDGPMPGAQDVRSPNANISNGYRRIVKMGQGQLSKKFRIKDLAPGTYSWGVQAIDQDYEGSTFAIGNNFVYEDPTLSNVTPALFPSNGAEGLSQSAIAWGDYKGNGHLDFVVSGQSNNAGFVTKLFEYDPVNSLFVEDALYSNVIVDVRNGSMAWGDFDQDGDLDLAITGESATGPVTRVYVNISGGFTATDTLQLLPLTNSTVKWADMNQDGYLDLVMIGQTNTGAARTYIYRNNGQGGLSLQTTTMNNFTDGDIAIGDVNNDGREDLLISGRLNTATGLAQYRLYLNQGNWTFTNTPITGALNVVRSSVALADINADGFLDVIMSGVTTAGVYSGNFIKNVNGTSWAAPQVLPGVADGAIAVGDYNEDGYPDLALVGETSVAGGGKIGLLYRYDPTSGLLVEETVGSEAIPNVAAGASAGWADFDQDGKLDLLVVGEATNKEFVLLRNLDATPNFVPDKPRVPTVQVIGNEVIFRWEPPLNVLPRASRKGVSYRIYLGTTSGSSDRISPMSSLATGYRRIVHVGHSLDTTAYRVQGLAAGTYFWGVQAVDADYEGSLFETGPSFAFELPTFEDVTSSSFATLPTGFSEGDLAWVDYDLDGDLDLMVAGNSASGPVATLYRNTNGNFAPVPGSLTGVRLAALSWADVNGDNRPDLLLTGETNAGVKFTGLYLNQPNGTLAISSSGLPALSHASISWADLDRDGDLDLLLSGLGASGPVTDVYWNNGSGGFTPANAGLTPLSDGTVGAYDFTNNGVAELFISGMNASNAWTTKIYRRQANGAYAEISSGLPGLPNVKASFADYDSDGDLDIAIMGGASLGAGRIYLNNGAASFSLGPSVDGATDGDLMWGDVDENGRPDLLVVGNSGSGRFASYYRGSSSGLQKSGIATLPLQAVDQASVALGDFDGDGKLDLALMGRSQTSPLTRVFRLYKNIETSPNIIPGKPSAPTLATAGDTLIFSWTPPSGSALLVNGYSYQLSIGTSNQGVNILSPNSQPNNGARLIMERGIQGQITSAKVIGLPSGTYFWGVQAVDQDFEGSGFEYGTSFTYQAPRLVHANATSWDQLPSSGLNRASVAWGDFDGDGLLDLAVAGETESGAPFTAIYSQKTGKLALDVTASQNLIAVKNASLAWSDYDLDGDLDLIVTGQPGTSGTQRQTILYRNTNGSFTNVTAVSNALPQVRLGSVAWGDVDQDGDPDLAIIGESATGPIGAIYLNEGGVFTLDRRRSIQAVQEGELAWGDFDRDGDLDLALTGANGTNLYGIVYRNRVERGDFVALTPAQAPFIKTKESALAWCDIDNDGDLDLIISGETSATQVQPATALYRYNAAQDAFALVNTPTIPGLRNGDVAFGDINSDGWPDLLLSGKFGANQADRSTSLFLGAPGGTFTLDVATSNHLLGADQGSAIALGDFDRDGKLDLVLVGQVADAAPRRAFVLYRNVDPAANTVPAVPRTPSTTVGGDTARLAWQAPLGLAPATAQGVSYNLVVQKLPAGGVVSPLAEVPDGLRRIAASGNAGLKNFFTLRDLDPGTYVWRVQAIDQDFDGGPFTATDTFQYSPPAFVEVSRQFLDVAIPAVTDGDAEWGDFDGDGDLDLILTGRTDNAAFYTEIFENIDNHSLLPMDAVSLGLPSLRESAVAWQDIDGDGDLDLAIAGLGAAGMQTRVLVNEAGSFQAVTSNFTGISLGDLAWIDYDHDGDADLLIAGKTSTGSVLALYRNNGDRTFTLINTTWPGLEEATLSVMDVNNDGYQDFVAVGKAGNTPRVILFLNDVVGDFLFGDILNATPVSQASVSWMDLDHDGLPDLLISGTDANGNASTEGLRNLGNGTFDSPSLGLSPLHLGALSAVDLDESGYGDLVVIGENDAQQRDVQVYLNTSGTDLIRNPDIEDDLPALSGLAVMAHGDFNGDGKPDLMMSGEDGTGRKIFLYQNNLAFPNRQPEAPEDLHREIVGSTVILSWAAPSGMSLEQVKGLTYQVTLQSINDEKEAIPGMADEDGIRKIVAHGSAGHSLSLPIKDLKQGQAYNWKVQAIGQDFEGSPYSDEDIFAYNPPAFDDKTSIVFSGVPPTPVAEARIALGDYDADGDLDLIAVGETVSGMASIAIYRNETSPSNNGKFVLDTLLTQDITAVSTPALAWMDVNGDGHLDLFLAGKQNDGTSLTRLYLYENGRYVQLFEGTESFPHLHRAMAGWADYDNDGDLDLALAGIRDDGSRFLGFFKQTSPLVWELDTEALASINNAAVADGDLAWGDYDKDGNIDLAISGTSDIGPVTRILRNNGNGVFSIGLYSDLLPARNSRLSWGDFDNDGDLDLLMTGDNSTQATFVPYTVVYQYLRADDRFSEFTNQSFQHLTQGTAAWGDFNNDGWLDILVSGKFADNDSSRATRLYRNQGGTSFIEDLNTSGDLVNVDLGAAVWGDYNGDQKLDVFLTGRTQTNPSTYTFVLFENIDTLANKVPVRPGDTKTTILGREVTLQWNSPIFLPSDLTSGLSYNLLLYPVNGVRYLTSPQADSSNGHRRIVRQGNVGHNLSWTFRDLEDGEYVWQVQTIDQDFEGSTFSDPVRFSFKNPIPKIISHSFPSRYIQSSDPVIARIEIDNPAIVDEVVIHFKGIASAEWKQATLTSTGTNFEFGIDQQIVDEMGLEYVFQLIGTFGYETYSDTGYTYLVYPNGLEVNGLRFGTKYDDYDVISIPLVLDRPEVNAVVEEYGDYNIRKWRLWHYEDSTLKEYTDSDFTTFEPGKGYWLVSKRERSFNTGEGRVVEANDAHPYEIMLQPGFNQIGTPFPFAVSWADVLAANSSEVQEALEDFLAYEGAYLPADRIKNLRGGFVFAHEPLTLRIPVRKNNAVQRTASTTPLSQFFVPNPPMTTQESWFLPMTLASGDKTYHLGGFGMDPQASISRDPFDRMAPPRFGDYLELKVPHSEYFHESFTRDVVPTAKHHVWEFTVESNLDVPELSMRWDPISLPQGPQQWILFDIDHQKSVVLHQQSEYRSISTQKIRHFRLYYGDEAFLSDAVQPDRVHLGAPYPNPSSTSVKIPFTIPSQNQDVQVRISLLNGLGQIVSTIVDRTFPEGFHEVTWDGSSTQGQPLPAGVYLYRLEVEGHADQTQRFQWLGGQ